MAATRAMKTNEQMDDGESLKKRQVLGLKFDWIPLFTLALTVFTAVAYGAGKGYREVYLSSFGLTDMVAPWSFQDLVYLGIAKQVAVLVVFPFYAALTVAGIALLIIILSRIGNWIATKQIKQSKRREQTEMNEGDAALLNIAQFMVVYLGSIFLIGLLALLFVAKAETLGKVDARAAKISLASGSSQKPKLPYVTIDRAVGGQMVTDAGYLVSCSERMCGLYSPSEDKGTSRFVPLDGVTLFAFRHED